MSQSDRTLDVLEVLSQGSLSRSVFAQVLAPASVRLTLSPEVADEVQAQALYTFLVNLVGRMYPIVQNLDLAFPPSARLRFTPPRSRRSTLEQHVSQYLKSLQPDLAWHLNRPDCQSVSCEVVVGRSSVGAEHLISVGSDGWIARVSSAENMVVGGGLNPVGAYAAACMAAGEVTKRVLASHKDLFPGVPVVPLEGSLSFSTLTFASSTEATIDGPNPDLPEPVDLQRLTIVGLGAGGMALAYTLATVEGLSGRVLGIDPDIVSVTNLNRLVSSGAGDVAAKRAKVEVLDGVFSHVAGVVVQGHALPYRDASPLLASVDLRHVVAAVDTREARRDLQHDTPAVLWDAAATETGEFYVWRLIFGTTECMECKHPPGKADPEVAQARVLAETLGLNQGTWLTKTRDNEPFTALQAEVIKQSIESAQSPASPPSVGERFSDWYPGQCGQLQLEPIEEEAPIPFAPVMAGVLLAGEVIKERCFPELSLDGGYWNTLLGKFMVHNRPVRRPRRSDCELCHDENFVVQHTRIDASDPT